MVRLHNETEGGTAFPATKHQVDDVGPRPFGLNLKGCCVTVPRQSRQRAVLDIIPDYPDRLLELAGRADRKGDPQVRTTLARRINRHLWPFPVRKRVEYTRRQSILMLRVSGFAPDLPSRRGVQAWAEATTQSGVEGAAPGTRVSPAHSIEYGWLHGIIGRPRKHLNPDGSESRGQTPCPAGAAAPARTECLHRRRSDDASL
jgi:hypothetical protein